VGRKASWPVVARFALPGAAAALVGAALLGVFARLSPLWSYQLGTHRHEIALIGLVIGSLITSFAILDLLPRFRLLSFNRRYLPLGGMISGFFGGLSGLQGALRSAFLIKAGLDTESFIGTSTVSAIIVDAARLLVYGLGFYAGSLALIAPGMKGLILAATLAAFVGSFVGTRLIKKITLHTIQIIVGVMLIVVGAGIATGLF
jgi:uncharacterized membrane protein YfcA